MLVRGLLGHLDELDVAVFRDEVDPRPWVRERGSWLVIPPLAITGRRLHAAEVEWAISLSAYL